MTRTADSVLLTCWPPAPLGAQRVDAQIGVVDGDVDVLRLGQHRDGCGRGVDAAGRFGVGHALHAVHAGFVFELGEGAAAADFGDDFLVAAHRAFARGHDFDLPALAGGVALVHAEQIAGEQRRLVAAGAGADFENDVALVHRILGNEREPQLLLERRAPRFELGPFGLGDGAHFGVGRRIRDQARQPVELALRVAIGLHRLDHRRKLGEFARQLHIGLGRQRRREVAFERGMAGDERSEFLVGQHF